RSVFGVSKRVWSRSKSTARTRGTSLLRAIGDEALFEVVGGDAHGDAVADDHADTEPPHLAVELRQNLMALAAVHLVMPTRENFRHRTLQFDQIFFTHLPAILALFRPGACGRS